MTRQQFLKRIAAVGATLDLLSEDNDLLVVDAPGGQVFSANGCHCIAEPFANNGGQSWKSDAYDEVIRMVDHGLYECDDPDCDTCEENNG
jgi:hypothetical protein